MPPLQGGLLFEMKFNLHKATQKDEELMTTVVFYEPLGRVEFFKKELTAVSEGYRVRPGDIIKRGDEYVLEVWVGANNPDQARWMYRKAGIKNYNHLMI